MEGYNVALESINYMVKSLKKYDLFDEKCLYDACKAENEPIVYGLIKFIKPTEKYFDSLTGEYAKDRLLVIYNEEAYKIKKKSDRAKELRYNKKKNQRIEINK